MATAAALLSDIASRIREHVHESVDGLTDDQLAQRIGGTANSIGWLVWHQARVIDEHVADAAGTDQLWTQQGWAERFDLPLEASDTGYGHSPEQVALVRVSAELLVDYATAAADQLAAYAQTLSDSDLDRVVDDAWDPPVTLAVRLVSVVDDCVQHLGQAALVRGLL